MRYGSTITSKGTITLPAELRAELGLKPGERVAIDLDSKTGNILVRRSPTLAEVRAMNKRRLDEKGLVPGLDAHELYAEAMREKYGRG